MILTKKAIKAFEREQKQFGTEVALFNFVWVIAADLFKAIGVHHVVTRQKRGMRARGK